MKSLIAEPLLRWYASRQRSLPWRTQPEPYAVWVAEIMAQQTRLESMLPYYQRWMARFPTLRSLAEAEQQEVLGLWEGLGYYSRARNLHRAAQMVLADYGGQLPGRLEDLRRLPGIGAYTAGAIASLAFGLDVPAVDGNAIRVLARVFDVDLPLGSGAAQQRFWQLAAEHLPPGKAAEYNQALMDLGASLCSPRRPQCDLCPLEAICQACQLGLQAQRPVRAVRAATPLRRMAAAVLCKGEQVLVARRPEGGLLGGLWEFPNLELQEDQPAQAQLRAAFGLKSKGRVLGEFTHAYSHFKVELQALAYVVEQVPTSLAPSGVWVRLADLQDLPMGKLDRSIANVLRHGLE
ncbi:MAG: A/G-specific adenine glycosylase [Anaerolineales bacterium]|nr:A/G-specific adenine glycosylase [Anaerolineales bacterium]MCW5855706.1 A/G-specific adenine glycosylase [Anaerolineales bacterium]